MKPESLLIVALNVFCISISSFIWIPVMMDGEWLRGFGFILAVVAITNFIIFEQESREYRHRK